MRVPLRIEFTARSRRAHRAQGFGLMRAVAEPALLGESVDIREGSGDVRSARPELKLAHARGVDGESAAFQPEHLTLRGGVPALRVRFAHFTRGLPLFAEESIDEGRLPRPRGTEE